MKAYNYQLLTKHGDVVDQTQLDEVNEELAREIFGEKRRDLSKYNIMFEEVEIEDEDNASVAQTDHFTAIFMAQELFETISDDVHTGSLYHPVLYHTGYINGEHQLRHFLRLSSLERIELIQTLANRFDKENAGVAWGEEENDGDDIETAILNFLKENLPTD